MKIGRKKIFKPQAKERLNIHVVVVVVAPSHIYHAHHKFGEHGSMQGMIVHVWCPELKIPRTRLSDRTNAMVLRVCCGVIWVAPPHFSLGHYSKTCPAAPHQHLFSFPVVLLDSSHLITTVPTTPLFQFCSPTQTTETGSWFSQGVLQGPNSRYAKELWAAASIEFHSGGKTIMWVFLIYFCPGPLI